MSVCQELGGRSNETSGIHCGESELVEHDDRSRLETQHAGTRSQSHHLTIRPRALPAAFHGKDIHWRDSHATAWIEISGKSWLQISEYIIYISECQYGGRNFDTPPSQYLDRDIRDLDGLENKLRQVSDESQREEKSNTKQKAWASKMLLGLTSIIIIYVSDFRRVVFGWKMRERPWNIEISARKAKFIFKTYLGKNYIL